MMRQWPLSKLLLIGVATFIAAALSFPACGSPSGATPGGGPRSTPSPTLTVETTPSPTPVSVSAPSPAPTPSQPVSLQGDADSRLARGEEIFQRLAGGVGCQYCHGKTAKGDIGPNIRGKPPEAIKQALGTNVQMFFISETTPLTEEDIEALAAYLKYLESQP